MIARAVTHPNPRPEDIEAAVRNFGDLYCVDQNVAYLSAIDTYNILMYTHLATVVPCIPLGAYLLVRVKGDAVHKALGKAYMGLMFFTAGITVFMPAFVGPIVFGHFGWIHLLSLLVLITVPRAILDAKAGRIKAHKRRMIMLYVGALLIAGAFTFWPGRYMHSLVFGG